MKMKKINIYKKNEYNNILEKYIVKKNEESEKELLELKNNLNIIKNDKKLLEDNFIKK